MLVVPHDELLERRWLFACFGTSVAETFPPCAYGSIDAEKDEKGALGEGVQDILAPD